MTKRKYALESHPTALRMPIAIWDITGQPGRLICVFRNLDMPGPVWSTDATYEEAAAMVEALNAGPS